MNKQFIKKSFLLIGLSLFLSNFQLKAQATPDKEEFISFWVNFKNAIKENDAKYLFSVMAFPFQSEGAYFNPEASKEDVQDNYKEVLPPYLREMEFVRFDVVMVENAGACIWLGYNYEENTIFTVKNNGTGRQLTIRHLEEKYYFKKINNAFKFYRMTAGNSGIEY
jgi:hypothetical protein